MSVSYGISIITKKPLDRLNQETRQALNRLGPVRCTDEEWPSFEIQLGDSESIGFVLTDGFTSQLGRHQVSAASILFFDVDKMDFEESAKAQRILGDWVKEVCKNMDIFMAAYYRGDGLGDFVNPIDENEPLTHISAITYLGEELISKVGRDRLKNSRAHELEEINSGIYIRPYESIETNMASVPIEYLCE